MRPALALALVAATAAAGCFGPEEAVGPEDDVSEAYTAVALDLDVQEAARAGDGVVVTATVANTGDRTMHYRQGCAPDEAAIVFVLLTPRGVPVRFDPQRLGCPETGPAELAPGEEVRGRFVFNGTLEGEVGEAPSGTYLVYASMHYWPEDEPIGEADYSETWHVYDSARFMWRGSDEPGPVALDLDVAPEAEAGGEVVVLGTVTNTGAASVWYHEGCPTPIAVDTYVNGERVASTWGPDADCDTNVPAELPPGANVTVRHVAPVEAAPGDAMTFVLRFQYWPTSDVTDLPEAIGTGEFVRVR